MKLIYLILLLGICEGFHQTKQFAQQCGRGPKECREECRDECPPEDLLCQPNVLLPPIQCTCPPNTLRIFTQDGYFACISGSFFCNGTYPYCCNPGYHIDTTIRACALDKQCTPCMNGKNGTCIQPCINGTNGTCNGLCNLCTPSLISPGGICPTGGINITCGNISTSVCVGDCITEIIAPGLECSNGGLSVNCSGIITSVCFPGCEITLILPNLTCPTGGLYINCSGIVVEVCFDQPICTPVVIPPGPVCSGGGINITCGNISTSTCFPDCNISLILPNLTCPNGGLHIDCEGLETDICFPGCSITPILPNLTCPTGGLHINCGGIIVEVCFPSGGCTQAPIPPGPICENGGTLITCGLDVSVICNGTCTDLCVNGTGCTQQSISPGPLCANGGTNITCGDTSEIICNGTSGNTSVVSINFDPLSASQDPPANYMNATQFNAIIGYNFNEFNTSGYLNSQNGGIYLIILSMIANYTSPIPCDNAFLYIINENTPSAFTITDFYPGPVFSTAIITLSPGDYLRFRILNVDCLPEISITNAVATIWKLN